MNQVREGGKTVRIEESDNMGEGGKIDGKDTVWDEEKRENELGRKEWNTN